MNETKDGDDGGATADLDGLEGVQPVDGGVVVQQETGEDGGLGGGGSVLEVPGEEDGGEGGCEVREGAGQAEEVGSRWDGGEGEGVFGCVLGGC